jgi:NADH dehydrogenase
MHLPEVFTDVPTVLVIGGSGFIGSHVVAKLSAAGARVIVPTRRYERAKHLIFLPRVEVVEANIGDNVHLERLLRGPGVDAVINLVGVLHSRSGTPYGPDFARAHVDLPRRIVSACAARGVGRYLHVSALGAAKDGPSMYSRSKFDGELAARSNTQVQATIFRPSVVFGPQDKFLNLFARMQSVMPLVPLAGASTRFQPIYVEDVAQAIVNALLDPQTRHHVYELGGPTVYTLRQLVELAGHYAGHPRRVIELPSGLGRLQASFLEMLPGGPLMSRDNLDSMKVDNIVSPTTHALTLSTLGVRPTALEAVAPHFLGQAWDRLGDFRSRAGR